MKKFKVIPIIVVIVVITFYGLLQATMKPQRVIVFSDDGDIVGDVYGSLNVMSWIVVSL